MSAPDAWTAARTSALFAFYHGEPAPPHAPADALITFRWGASRSASCLSVHGCSFEVGDEGTVQVGLRADLPFAPHDVVQRIFGLAVVIALATSGVLVMHAAGVARRDLAMLLLGPSGSGKTTLTLRLASRGWRYLSDDTVGVESGPAGLLVHALRRQFRMEAADAPFVEESVRAVLRARGGEQPRKHWLSAQAAFPGALQRSCRPDTLVFTSVSGALRSTLVAQSRAVAMARLAALTPWAGLPPALTRATLATLAALARDTTAFELRAGRDVFEDADHAAALFDDLAASSVA